MISSENFKKYFSNKLIPIEQVFLADFNGKLLFDFIPSGKKIYSHYGINGISIFLEPKIIDLGLRLKLEDKYDIKNNIGKTPLPIKSYHQKSRQI